MKIPQTNTHGKQIKRVPGPDGDFIAIATTKPDTELAVEFAPGVPQDPADFRAWVKAQNAKLNGDDNA